MIEETDEQLLNRLNYGNLAGLNPAQVMLHGPTKRLIDAYYWHSPNKGIVAGYAPTERDVEDHFGVFRYPTPKYFFSGKLFLTKTGFMPSVIF